MTYVDRVPPKGSDQPVYSESNAARAPVNLLGNVALIRIVELELGRGPRTPVRIGQALHSILNPPPDGNGRYPKAKFETVVRWWDAFLDKARTGDKQDHEVAALLTRIFINALGYFKNGYATGAIAEFLSRSSGGLPRL